MILDTAPIKILLVDDLKNNLLALEGLLRRDDVEIFQATSGIAALELIMAHEFAVALIDVQMPIMNGFELAELMRGAKKTKTIPIIFVTATALGERFSFKGYESGAVDFLLKPLDTFAVQSKVNIFLALDRQKKALENQLATITNLHASLQQSKATREVEKEILDITQAEQRRFGSQLHDGLCQDLAGIMLVMKSLTQKMEREKSLDVADLKNVSTLLEGAVSQARDMARGLYPGELEGNSLVYMLKELTASRNLSGVACRFHCPEPIRISDNAIATHLYKIAQEGIANAVTHGKATAIEVRFVREQDHIVLTITDDGVGFDGDKKNAKGIGLKIMKNRAHIMGADLLIAPNTPHGVILTCTLAMSE